MYIKLMHWAIENFDKNSIPTTDTLQRLCREGKIPNAEKIGKKWYIKIEKEPKTKGVKNDK